MSSGETIEFTTSYDRTTKIVSALTCCGSVAAAFAVPNIVIRCILLLLGVLGYAYSPRGYRVGAGRILVRRLVGTVDVPLAGMRDARRIVREDLRGGIRLWGSGGLFGYYGLFWTSKLGKCTWYVTNRKNAVVVIGAARTTLYSPDDVGGFLKAVRDGQPAA